VAEIGVSIVADSKGEKEVDSRAAAAEAEHIVGKNQKAVKPRSVGIAITIE